VAMPLYGIPQPDAIRELLPGILEAIDQGVAQTTALKELRIIVGKEHVPGVIAVLSELGGALADSSAGVATAPSSSALSEDARIALARVSDAPATDHQSELTREDRAI
jgi:hypothetical protein